MAFGLGFLRLAPQHFWQMTPREITAASGYFSQRSSIDKINLAALCEQFPDGSAQ